MIFTIAGDIEYDRVSELVDYLENLPDPAYILIRSRGGDAEIGMAMYDLLRAYPNQVVTIAAGMVASAALFIFLAGDERWALPHSCFYMHSPIMENSVVYTAKEGIKVEMDEFYDRVLSLFADSGISKRKIESYFKNAKIITIEEAIKMGIVTKKITIIPENAWREVE